MLLATAAAATAIEALLSLDMKAKSIKLRNMTVACAIIAGKASLYTSDIFSFDILVIPFVWFILIKCSLAHIISIIFLLEELFVLGGIFL